MRVQVVAVVLSLADCCNDCSQIGGAGFLIEVLLTLPAIRRAIKFQEFCLVVQTDLIIDDRLDS